MHRRKKPLTRKRSQSSVAETDKHATKNMLQIHPQTGCWIQEREEGDVNMYKTNVDTQYASDVTIEILYKPHTITAAIVVVFMLVYLAFIDSEDRNLWNSVRAGVGVASAFLIILGLLIFPSGPFIRPHPLVWRLAFGVGLLYELWLIMMLFLNKNDARYMMRFLHDDLNVPLQEREYAANCQLSFSNVIESVDIYFAAHFLGWICKTMVLRDRLLCWTISITWELVEIAFTYMLPNFSECWWDQLFLDVLIGNALGIYIGRKLCDFFELRPYKWKGVLQIDSMYGKLERIALQFTPATWMAVRWNKFATIKRFLIMNAVVVCFHISELNAFFLKHILWIPPHNPLNVIRLIIWLSCGLPAWRQLYVYATDKKCKRIGNHSFICLCIVCTELLIIFKFGKDEFPNPMPDNIYYGTIIFFTLYSIFASYIMYAIYQRNRKLEKLKLVATSQQTDLYA